MIKPAFIIGTRPEAIKQLPLILRFRKGRKYSPVVIATAQHREMLDQILRPFKIKADYDLDIMRENQSLPGLTSRLLEKIDGVLKKCSPDMIFVQGDTTTTFISALAGFYRRIPVAHVEAGLRSFDKHNPYPEEINRKLASVLADIHFAPTKSAADNLIGEGVDQKRVFVTGNTVLDALMLASSKKCAVPGLGPSDFRKRIVLVTVHRRESFGEGLRGIFGGIRDAARKRPDCLFVYPVHRNPNVRSLAGDMLGGVPNIRLLDPLEYVPFVSLMKRSFLILTDSGGIQEEAPSLKKPVIVLRKVTERPEGVERGLAVLAGTDSADIASVTLKLLDSPSVYKKMQAGKNPYGDGLAADRIYAVIDGYFSGGIK